MKLGIKIAAWTAVAVVGGCTSLLLAVPDQPRDGGMSRYGVDDAGEQHLRHVLKDGASARIERDFVSAVEGVGPQKYVYCGEVNAKNGFGAFMGFRRFIASANDDGPVLLDDGSTDRSLQIPGLFNEVWRKFCSRPV